MQEYRNHVKVIMFVYNSLIFHLMVTFIKFIHFIHAKSKKKKNHQLNSEIFLIKECCYLLVWKHLWKLENGILSGVRFAMKNVHHLKFCFGIL